MNKLSLGWRMRAGGTNTAERRYLDFLVDGRGLIDRVHSAFKDSVAGDTVGILGWQRPQDDEQAIGELLLTRKGIPALQGRVPLYVCPECGSIDCGAITVIVERTMEGYSWSGFRYENDYDPVMTDVARLSGLGPFLFAATDYELLLRGFLSDPRSQRDYY